MGLRLIAVLLVFATMPAAIAHDIRPRTDSRVHEAGICWDPDVEFPVPCDDDDD